MADKGKEVVTDKETENAVKKEWRTRRRQEEMKHKKNEYPDLSIKEYPENHMSNLTNNWTAFKLSTTQQSQIYRCRLGRELIVVKSYNSLAGGKEPFENEIDMFKMAHLKSLPIARCTGYNSTGRNLCLMMPYYPTNLTAAILGLSWLDTMKILKQVSSGMQFIHVTAKLVHMDIKPDNVLLDEENNAYLTDFGSLKACGKTLQSATTKEYRAPELETRNGKITEKIDIYSFGLVILQLMYKQPAIEREKDKRVAFKYPTIFREAQKKRGKSVADRLKEEGCSKTTANTLVDLAIMCMS